MPERRLPFARGDRNAASPSVREEVLVLGWWGGGGGLMRPTTLVTYPAGGLGAGQVSLTIIEESPVRIILG